MKNGKKAKAAKKATKRMPKVPKVPFKLLVGRVLADGKKYDFKERHAFKTQAEAKAGIDKALADASDNVRELILVINHDAVAA